jgi:16S rRNA (cytidine1402-2'-O)-methyltransferase
MKRITIFARADDRPRPRRYRVDVMRSPPASAHRTSLDRTERDRYLLQGQSVIAPALAGGLYLVATPIGNLRDITVRALEVLAAADLIACEDTRVTRKLTDHYGITTSLTPYHDHNAAQARPKLLARLAEGAAVALVSDAGTPLVSDPGFKLVRAAQAAGCAVSAVPGASAVLAALTVAGLPTDRFFFEGFLPAKEGQRRSRIGELARIPATLVLFESGPRLAAALADLSAGLGPREAAICRELTKLHEEVRRGELATLAGNYAGAAAPRGEIVIVIAPPDPQAQQTQAADLDTLLRAALGHVSLKQAVAEVAAVTGSARREVYQRALTLVKEREANPGAPHEASSEKDRGHGR